MDKELRYRAISGIAYNSVGKIVTLLLRVVASIILARNLTASDYGVVGFAMIIIGFLYRFHDLGLGSAVVQKIETNQRDLYTAFSLKVIVGTLICGLCIVLAPNAKRFFDHPDIGPVIQILAMVFVISSFSFLPEVVLTRDLKFGMLSLANILSSVVRSAVSIGLVFAGFKYWSLVWAEIGAASAQVFALNFLCRNRPKFRFDRKRAIEFLSFGGKLFSAGLIVFLIFNSDNFIVGAAAGPIALGFYALAFNWGSFSCGIINDSVHTVLFPTFSKTQKDKAGLKQAYLKVVYYVSTIGIMLNILLIANSREILVYVLGRGTDKWVPAVLTLQILSVYGIARIILEPVGNIILAVGKPGILLKANLVAGTLEVGLLYFALKVGGINGVAILVTAAYAIQYAVYLPFLKKEFDINLREIFGAVRPALISGFLITVSALMVGSVIEFSITLMAVKFVYCILGYAALHGLLTNWRIFKEAKGILTDRLSLKIGHGMVGRG